MNTDTISQGKWKERKKEENMMEKQKENKLVPIWSSRKKEVDP